MTIHDTHLRAFIKGLTFFSGLPEADMQAFLNAAHVRTYKKGEKIFHQGDKADSFYVIVSGWLKLYRTTPEGEEALVALFTRGDICAEAALFPDSFYPLSAQAVSEMRMFSIPASVLRERAQKNPDIAMRMLAVMSKEMNNLQRQNEHMAIMSASQRVACLLLQLSSDMIGTGGTMTFPYDKSLAAARLGMTAETFSRALSQLKSLGINSKGTEVTIDSFAKLTSYACNHCTAPFGECKGFRGSSCALKSGKSATVQKEKELS